MLAATPILTRLYPPESFGLLAAYVGMLGVFGVVSTLRYELAIPLPESDKTAACIFTLSAIIIIFVTLCVSLIVYLLGGNIGRWLNLPEIVDYLWLLPIGVFLLGFYNICNYWAIRTRNFKSIAKTKVIHSIVVVAIQLGLSKIGAIALLLGSVVGQSASSGSLGVMAVKKYSNVFSAIKTTDIVKVCRDYRRFPIFSTWTGLFNSIGEQGPNILFAMLFSPTAAGLFFMASRIMRVPMSLVGAAIGQAFLAEAADASRNGTLHTLALRTVRKLALVIALPIVFIAVYGSDIIAFVLGEEWRQTGEIVQWLTPMVAFQFITSPIGQLLALRNKQNVGLILQGILTIFRLGAIFIGLHFDSFIIAIILFSVLSSLGYLFFLYFSISYSK